MTEPNGSNETPAQPAGESGGPSETGLGSGPTPYGSFAAARGDISINGIVLEEGLLVPVVATTVSSGEAQRKVTRLVVRVSAPVSHVRWSDGDLVTVTLRRLQAATTCAAQIDDVSDPHNGKRTTRLTISGKAADEAARILGLVD
jgi:hypothetical protein